MIFGDRRVPARIWDKIHVSAKGHWEWIGCHSGHCQVRIRGKTLSVKRYLYEIEHGPQVAPCVGGCDARCVKPRHQIAGTITEVLRRVQRHRPRALMTHCVNGHDVVVVGIFTYRSRGRKIRQCRACQSLAMAKWHAKIKKRRLSRMSPARRKKFVLRSKRARQGWKHREQIAQGAADRKRS